MTKTSVYVVFIFCVSKLKCDLFEKDNDKNILSSPYFFWCFLSSCYI